MTLLIQITFTNVLTIIILKNGVPSVFIFNGVHDYHQKTDTPDKIEYDALTKRAQLAFTVAWELTEKIDR
jgi:hypothetical protein